MFLLNSILITQYLDDDELNLSIDKFKPDNLEHTFYYFTLGAEGTLNGKPFKLNNCNKKYLTLLPDDFATVKSLETFTLNAKLLGILGSCSDTAKQGLMLLHGPTIDPKYNKPLEFGLKNISKEEVILEYGISKIGKVSFFDISDTYPVKIRPNSTFAKRFLEGN